MRESQLRFLPEPWPAEPPEGFSTFEPVGGSGLGWGGVGGWGGGGAGSGAGLGGGAGCLGRRATIRFSRPVTSDETHGSPHSASSICTCSPEGRSAPSLTQQTGRATRSTRWQRTSGASLRAWRTAHCCQRPRPPPLAAAAAAGPS